MRLFAAVDPPAEAVESLQRALGAAPGAEDDRLRATPPSQWHVTLAFYGEVPSRSVAELVARLSRAAARTSPFAVRVSGAGGFPSAGRARVQVMTLAGDVPALVRLADRCAAAGRRTGLDLERRAFRPHLTVGRARREPVDLRPVVGTLASYDGPPWPVSELRLVRSSLGASVVHETVERFVLSAEPGHQA